MTSKRVSVDDVAVVITAAGLWMPSAPAGAPPRMGPVDSVDKLAQALSWLVDRGHLSAHGTLGQVWVLGAGAVDALGWLVDPGQIRRGMTRRQLQDAARERLAEAVAESRPVLERRGWTLRTGWESGGCRIRLERLPEGRPAARGRDRRTRVDVVLEPFAWTTGGSVSADDDREFLGVLGSEAGGTGLPDTEADPDAARVELSRRLAWCVEHLGMLPATTGAATGAALAERIWRDGEHDNARRAEQIAAGRALKSHPAVVPAGPGPIPPLVDAPIGDIEPRVSWARIPDPAEVAEAVAVVVTDQRGSYLGSAGSKLAMGEPAQIPDPEAAGVLWFSDLAAGRWPRGLWLISAPTAAEVPGWAVLPPFHQTWWESGEAEYAPVFWVTTETLAGMAADPDKGGYGIEWCRAHVGLIEGWAWPDPVTGVEREPGTATGTALKKWQETVAGAYKAALAAGDDAMRALAGSVYKGYIGRLSWSPDRWGEYRARHSQPVWYNQLHAHATVRNRRKAAEIHARTGLWPVRANTDDLTYLVPAGVDPDLLADPDNDGAYTLGRMVIKEHVLLTDEVRAELAAAEDLAALRRAVDHARGKRGGDGDAEKAGQ